MPEYSEAIIRELFAQIDRLQRRIERLETNQAPTIPIYNSDRFPLDAVEGQVVIAKSGGVGGSSGSLGGGSGGGSGGTGGTSGSGTTTPTVYITGSRFVDDVLTINVNI